MNFSDIIYHAFGTTVARQPSSNSCTKGVGISNKWMALERLGDFDL